MKRPRKWAAWGILLVAVLVQGNVCFSEEAKTATLKVWVAEEDGTPAVRPRNYDGGRL